MVIGREKVDNYLMSIPQEEPVSEEDKAYTAAPNGWKWFTKGHLIDTSNNGEVEVIVVIG